MTPLSKVVKRLEEITSRCESVAVGSADNSADIKEQLEEICDDVCELEKILDTAEKLTPGIKQITAIQFNHLKELLQRGQNACQTNMKDKST